MATVHQRYIIFLLFSFFAVNATAQQNGLKRFSLLPETNTGIGFRNDVEETSNMFLYLYENLYNGGGVSIGDINNDGLQDIYFSSTLGSNKLYLNLGNLTFRDITASAGVNGGDGVKTGVNMIDINNDGYLDIFICKSGYKDARLRKKILYINNRNLSFTNQAAEYGLEDASFSMQAYFFDYDKDGDKDVYFVNHPGDFTKSMNIPVTSVKGKLQYVEDTSTVHVSDRLYENRGNKFTDITKKAGLIDQAFGLSASIADINGDGWPDIYTANDFNKPDFLYINNKNGTFTNKLSSYINHVSFSSMGSDITDINNDGHEDIYVVDMAVEDPVRQKQLFAVNQNYDKFQLLLRYGLYYQYPRNTLQLNNADGTYSEVANYAGVAETDWSWAPLIVDFDNDGWKDMYVTNGLKRDMTDWDYKVFVLDSVINAMNKGKYVDLNEWLKSMPSVPVKNYFYRNNGTLRFDNYTDNWTDAPPSFSNGAAYADLDNDGDLDIVVNNVDGPAFVMKNNTREMSTASHFLRLRFFKSPSSPVEIYGTIVKLTDAKGQVQLQHYDPQRGFLSTMEHALHFGIGNEGIIPRVEILFPSQKKIVLENVKADQEMTVYESDATNMNTTIAVKKNTTFKDISATGKLRYSQLENDFIDFKREPLIPYKCSRKGPYFAKADINADGKEDLYIGGAAGYEGKLMIQNANGSFSEKKQAAFIADKDHEDMGALFFDADGDTDMDLYVVSGGAEFSKGHTLYQDRLYKNDGKGNFTRTVNAIPAEGYNGSSVTALDFDADGDMDLFVGGHVLPGRFPQPDRSMLLQNNKGIFTDITFENAKELFSPGIVNQAVWADIDGDGKKELSISGEWMPLEIFSFQNGRFSQMQNSVHIKLPSKKDTVISMDAFSGWWYNMRSEDIDGDGDPDFVFGNRGLNSSIKGNINEPCTIYAKDFDNNGSYDAVLGYYIHGKCYPLFSRDQLMDQMPGMRKKFVRYRQYSGKTLDEIFTTQEKKGMEVFKTNFFESGVLVNEGKAAFRFIPFPEKAQFSNINDLVIDDIDADGIKDILVCGNSSDPAVMVGNYDATSALMLKGTGGGNFVAVSPAANGLSVRGESRKMIYLKDKNGTSLIFLKNNLPAQVFTKE
ncbi:MAG TPA: VCBS repeat-containing protein [Ferruginibacter sp.]|nr:VCBS repeat-containing protein [Ferruginibacter sp.]